jgi:hypothetical protein
MPAPSLKPCPFCAELALEYDDDELSVVCRNCGATGPQGHDELDAIEGWNGAGTTEPKVVVNEAAHPSLSDAVTMTVQWGTIILVEVGYCHDDYAATLRGALTLIGGMRQAREAVEVDE